MRWSVSVFMVLALGFFYSCQSPSSLSRSRTTFTILPFESESIQLGFYHTSSDSTELMLQLRNSELLASKRDTGGNKTAKVLVELIILDSLGSNRLDTIKYDISGKSIDSSAFYYFHKYAFPLVEDNIYTYVLKLTDINRGASFVHSDFIHKTNQITEEDFKIISSSDSTVVLNNQLKPNYSYQLRSSRRNLTTLSLKFFNGEFSLPPPPHSSSGSVNPDLNEWNITNQLTSGSSIQLRLADEGSLLIQSGTSSVTYLSREPEFITYSSVASLAPPLRYISSRKEFERMNAAENLKNGVEQFWLDCGETKDRSKELMNIFYRRVQKANLNFSSYKSGWKTDRGLIYIVFGEPTSIYKKPHSETWVYGDKDDIGNVEFQFKKSAQNLSQRDYVLTRNPIYKSEWSKRVSTWRNGRIYN